MAVLSLQRDMSLPSSDDIDVDPPNRKRVAIYTNGGEEEIDSEIVIRLICRRWGEENKIKELMMKHFIDNTPGYVRESMAERPLVDNPKVKKMEQEKARSASDLHNEIDWEEVKKNQIDLLADIVAGENKILFLEQELEKLPKEIHFDLAHGGKKLLKHNYEKKRFLIQKTLASMWVAHNLRFL